MQDRNEIVITGTVSNEPKVVLTKTGVPMAQFTASVRRPSPSKSSDFLNVTAFDAPAAKIEEEFHISDRITVKGRMQKQLFIGKDGHNRNYFRILATEIEKPEEEDEEEEEIEEADA